MPHYDLHLHLLPGVDDGPPDEAASLAHAERMARAGVLEACLHVRGHAHGIPAGPGRNPAAWRPQHEQRMRAAIAAVRRITPAG